VELDEVAYTKSAGVAEIMLNRPEQLNPISARRGGTRDQILWAADDAVADGAIRAIVLRGAGGCFSAGGDLTGNVRRETAFEQHQFIDVAETFHSRLRALPMPIIAAVHGYCYGAALSLVAACDLVVAGRSARFSLPEGRLGLVGVSPLITTVGRQWAKFMMFTGEALDADQARAIGIAFAVEDDDVLFERAHDLAQRLARMPTEALVLHKRGIDAVADAAGDAAARLVAAPVDALTLSNSARATAPDGRSFREIIETEGIAGLKQARSDQYDTPWLRRST
jgi:enoyl-CoA hydratase/carnithine racemase